MKIKVLDFLEIEGAGIIITREKLLTIILVLNAISI
jgi:hypothetical protein